ncbi:MAG: winged helix-turn-helix transcriptional regulator [Rhodospirillaceae bacterium]|nr:winged helix-turn-helix transcriptional regulator [Rhodospirillaceae bacterium]MCK5547354.1 winged helix-turn-helix transcriptional regulator [Rhodospirillaceae bacterium]
MAEISVNIEDLEKSTSVASGLLKAMSNQTRLMILCQLLRGEKTAGELDSATQLSQSALSQHLAVLRDHGLVQTRRQSQNIYYSLAGEEPKAIIEVLYSIYNQGDEDCA